MSRRFPKATTPDTAQALRPPAPVPALVVSITKNAAPFVIG